MGYNLKTHSQVCTCSTAAVPITGTWSLGSVNGGCYNVTGTLTFNTVVTLTNCVFNMAAGSKIQISGGTNIGFAANKCCFKGTTSSANFWNTIDVGLGAIASFNGCWIQDAYCGITGHQQFASASPVSVITTIGTTFYNNNLGISTPSVSGTSFGDLKLNVANCEFKGDPYSPGNPSQANYGIDLYNLKYVDLTSSISGTTNWFHDLRYKGIHLWIVGTSIVKQCVFNNIDYDQSTSVALMVENQSLIGSGILCTVTQQGLGSSITSPYSFYNVSAGVGIFNAQSNISKNNMQVGLNATELFDCQNSTNVVNDNRVTNTCKYLNGSTLGSCGDAIDVLDCNPYGKNSNVYLNHINSLNVGPTSGAGSGIFVNNWSSNVSGYGLDIMSNYLNMQDAKHGIHTYQLSMSRYTNNFCDIKFHNWGVLQSGIDINYGNGDVVQCNNIISNSQTGSTFSGTTITSPIGINAFNVQKSGYRCNNLGDSHGLATGMHFDQTSTGTDLVGNKFNYTGTGLVCGWNSCALLMPGGIVCKGNEWKTPAPSGGLLARHFGGTPFVQASKIYINPTDPSTLVPNLAFVNPSTSWFQLTSASSGIPIISQCASGCDIYTPPPALLANKSFSEADFQEALGYDSTSDYPLTEEWVAARNVFDVLNSDSVLRYSDSNYLAYYLSKVNTPIELFTDIENRINALNGFDSVLNNYYLKLDSVGHILEILDSTYVSLTYINDSSGMVICQLQRDSLIVKLTMIRDSASVRYANIYVHQGSEIANLLLLVNELPEDEIYEWSTKTIYQILLTTTLVGNFNFTAQQQSDIITISNECPLQAGKAVLTARGLWHYFEKLLPSFNDVVTCLTHGYLYKSGRNLNKNGINIFPNPANDVVNIGIDGMRGEVEIGLFNLFGQTVLKNKLVINSCNITLDVSQIQPGIYTMIVRDEKGETKRTKLEIE